MCVVSFQFNAMAFIGHGSFVAFYVNGEEHLVVVVVLMLFFPVWFVVIVVIYLFIFPPTFFAPVSVFAKIPPASVGQTHRIQTPTYRITYKRLDENCRVNLYLLLCWRWFDQIVLPLHCLLFMNIRLVYASAFGLCSLLFLRLSMWHEP